MKIPFIPTKPTPVNQCNVIEAFNLWDTLRARYGSIELNAMLLNLVHDLDLAAIIMSQTESFKKEAKIMEDLIVQIKLKAPARPPSLMEFSVNVDQITDNIVFRYILNQMMSQLFP